MNPPHLTRIVLNLIIVNVIVFIAVELLGDRLIMDRPLFSYFMLFKSDLVFNRGDYSGLFNPVQLVTSFFMHGGIWHIFMNMYVLSSIGPPIEMVLKEKRFLEFYLFTGFASSVLIWLFDPSSIPVLGASTSLSGLIVAFAFLYPNAKLGILFLPVQFKARDFAIGVAVISVVLFLIGLKSGDSVGGISHFGHLMGMLSAVIYIYGKSLITRLLRRE